MQYQYKSNLKKRFIASLLDYLVIMVGSFLYLIKFGTETDEGSYKVEGFLAIPPMILWFLYFVVIEAYYGATLGHKALNLLVLTDKRKKIGFEEALKRHLLDPIDFFMYAIPAIVAIRNTVKKQRLGDLWAKTIVVDITDSTQYDTGE